MLIPKDILCVAKVSRDAGNCTCQYIVISAQGSASAIESRDISLR